MIDLTPKTAGASTTAIRIAQRILDMDGMTFVRELFADPPAGYDLAAFAADIARQIDVELNDPGEARQALINLLAEYDEVRECGRLAGATFYGHSPAPAAARAVVDDIAIAYV